MLALYNFGLFLYNMAIRAAAWFQPKARQWLAGRKAVAEQLQQLNPERPTLWMHCASLGEFEQGRPVLEQIKSQFPQYQILLTFFSPSGYEVRKNYPLAEVICYLPLDSKSNAKAWLDQVRPQMAIFVKYEFWHHYLFQLQERRCPTLLISASFRPGQIFFRSYGLFFRRILERFSHIFVQEKPSKDLLLQHNIQSVSVAGDTRIDRVCQIAAEARAFPLIQQFVQDHPVLILGSSWPEEEQLLIQYLKQNPPANWKYIIAPHEIGDQRIRQLQGLLPLPSIRYSQATAKNLEESKILIIDNVGMLSALYRYGRIAIIGGGFGKGIHNTLEPIAFGLPVLFGPKHQKFMEATELVKAKGAFAIHNLEELKERLNYLQQENNYQKATTAAKAYLDKNRGATTQIIDFLKNKL